MTIQTAVHKARFIGDGVNTTFPFSFKTFSTSDLQLTQTSTAGVDASITSLFSIALNSDQEASPGGTITYPTSGPPMATGVVLTVSGVLAETQLTDLTNAGGFFPKTITDRFDYITILIQQHAEKLARALFGSVSDITPNFSLGTAAQRALKYITFDASGNVALAASLPSGTLSRASIGGFLYPQTSTEVLASVVPSDLSYPFGNVRRYGAVLDGVTNDRPALASAVLIANAIAASGVPVFKITIDGPMAVATNITLPTTMTVEFIGTGAFVITTGQTITFNGTVIAQPSKIFQNATVGLGTVAFSTNKQRVFYLEWWGAKGDSVTGDDAAIAACLPQASNAQGTVQLVGNYAFTNSFTVPQNTEIVGYGKSFGTQLTPLGTANINFTGSSLRCAIRRVVIEAGQCTNTNTVVIGNSGTAYNITLEDIYLHGLTTNAGNTVGILMGNAGGGGNAYNCVLNRVSVYGNGGATDTGIFITSGTLAATLLNCDVEACFQGVQITGTAQADIIGLYAERNSGYAIRINGRTGAGNLNIKGGTIQNANAGTTCIGLDPNCSDIYIDGINLVLTGGTGITTNSGGTFTRCNIKNVPIGNITDPNRVFNITHAGRFSGTAVFSAATTQAVNFAASAANATYVIKLTQSASQSPGCTWSAKATGGFSINFAAAYTGSVDWEVTL